METKRYIELHNGSRVIVDLEKGGYIIEMITKEGETLLRTNAIDGHHIEKFLEFLINPEDIRRQISNSY